MQTDLSPIAPDAPEASILLVDDVPANLLALRAILDAPGHLLVEAGSGEEALRLILHDDFAVVLLDLRLPGLDGFETARLIRSRKRSRHTPIIFLTAQDCDDFPVVEAYKLGAVDYLVKPLFPEILRAKVAVFVELFQKARQVERQAEQLRRAQQEQSRRRVLTQHAVAGLLAESVSFKGAVPGVLRVVCEGLGWDAGLFWTLDRQGAALVCAEAWLGPGVEAAEFEAVSRERPLAPGVGLPGRVWSSGEPAWITDVAHDSNFTRGPQAVRAGLRGACAIPIRLGQEALGVLEFFSRAEGPPDAELVRVMEAVGSQVGQFLERKRAEAALKESEARFRTLATHAPVGIFLTDARGNCLLVNDRWCAMAGLTPEEARGEGWVRALHPEDKDRVFSAWYEAAQAGREFACEYRFQTPQGHVTWLSGSAVAQRDDNGRLIGHIGTLTDVTDRRLAEEEMRRSEERLRRVVEEMPVMLDAFDVQGVIVAWNKECERVTGYAASEVIGNPRALELLYPDADYRGRMLTDWKERGHDYRDWEWRLTARDGSVKTVVWSNLSGRFPIAGWASWGIGLDVTQRKEAEEALREASRRKDEFLAMLAHELRNPLAPMLTGLEALRQAGSDPAIRGQVVDRMERQARHLGRLVEDLLEASRVAHGRVSLRPERLDLARLARTAAEDRRALLEGAGLALTVETSGTPVWVKADATRLSQVLNNLLDNAGKFCDAGGQVTVQVEADVGRGQAALVVRDDCAGIATEVLPRLFQPFAQAEQGLARKKGGLGLGLSVVKGLVELHSGSVEAASDGPGRGSTFTVRLPLEAEPDALAALPPPLSPEASEQRHRVLVVEDNRDSADSLCQLLGLLGHETRAAYTGPDGVRLATEWLPDVVLSDIGLPGFDGYEVARRVRKVAGMEGTLLVAITGYGGEEDRRRSRDAGFDHHLTKPAAPDDLQRLLAGRVA